MKYAWWFIVGLILFLLCTQQTFAAEVAGFDPTKQYVVHTMPLVVDDPVIISFDNQQDSPVVSPVEHTPEAGSEGKQEISLAESTTNIDLSNLTNAAQQQQTSSLSSFVNKIYSWFSFVKDEVSTFIRSGWANASANLMQFSFSSILAISSRLNKIMGDLTLVLNKYINFVREHAVSFALLAVGGPVLAVLAASTFGRAILTSVAQFAVAGVVSVADLVLHAGSYSFGLLRALRTGSSVLEGYVVAKEFIKKKTGHDIGDVTFDVQTVATRLIVAIVIFAAFEFLVGGVAAATAISAETAPELILRSNIALSKTSIDCNMPGQCDTPVALGITAGSNFLFGVAPKANMQLVDDEAKSVSKTLKNTANEITVENSMISSVIAENQFAVKPQVIDSKLNNIVENLYKGIENPRRVGSGTTADAIRYEMKTGEPVFGRFHSQKGEESVQALKNWLKKNPAASELDIKIASELIEDLTKALNGK